LALFLLIHKRLDIISERFKANQWAITFIFLLNDIRMLEVMLKLSSALDTCIADLTYLGGIELFPSMIMKLSIEIFYKFRMYEIQEGISHVTVILHHGRSTL
jgi:hypothetical protein